MGNLFKAFLFKLRRDLTFRITLFVGLGLSILMALIYFGIDKIAEGASFKMCTGQTLFITSLSPTQNFGIAIPVNLISFTVLEFSQGTIRNKIIAGNSKGKIYLGLFFNGLVFSLLLLATYSLLCLAWGSILGGFDINGAIFGTVNGLCNPEFFWKLIVLTLACYVFITSFTIFFATLLRNIGPCIPIVIMTLIALMLVSTLGGAFNEDLANVLKIVNPIHGMTAFKANEETGKLFFPNDVFYWAIGNNIFYTLLFTIGGMLIFQKRDVK